MRRFSFLSSTDDELRFAHCAQFRAPWVRGQLYIFYVVAIALLGQRWITNERWVIGDPFDSDNGFSYNERERLNCVLITGLQ